ncbi:hypothetical protein RHMOL_Rhmol01G0116400 [Rhododendron molle]|uniref:Uncharacterized protein n=1 Tax=Rhododendron molle TaxID=49168 RepID=A0ACC0Q336_RHOML|nr:hypothetical protein RHMOL_Rhmol01G0116400 [Rhododendron molle]
MSTSGNEPHEHEREHEHESSDDDLMDLEMLSMSSEDEVNRIPQRTFLAKGQTYTHFLMTEHPTTIKDLLRVDKRTFKSLVSLLVDKGELKWDHMRLSVEESLAMFLYICGHNERHRVVGHWFQHSTDTISKHFKRMRRALCTVAPIIIQPPNLDATPSEILNDARYYPYFELSSDLFSVQQQPDQLPFYRQLLHDVSKDNGRGLPHDDILTSFNAYLLV